MAATDWEATGTNGAYAVVLEGDNHVLELTSTDGWFGLRNITDTTIRNTEVICTFHNTYGSTRFTFREAPQNDTYYSIIFGVTAATDIRVVRVVGGTGTVLVYVKTKYDWRWYHRIRIRTRENQISVDVLDDGTWVSVVSFTDQNPIDQFGQFGFWTNNTAYFDNLELSREVTES